MEKGTETLALVALNRTHKFEGLYGSRGSGDSMVFPLASWAMTEWKK